MTQFFPFIFGRICTERAWLLTSTFDWAEIWNVIDFFLMEILIHFFNLPVQRNSVVLDSILSHIVIFPQFRFSKISNIWHQYPPYFRHEVNATRMQIYANEIFVSPLGIRLLFYDEWSASLMTNDLNFVFDFIVQVCPTQTYNIHT